jgi:hypothetical protein
MNEQEQWIIDWLNGRPHEKIDACDEEFHEAFHQRFGGARAQTYFGAQRVYKAQRLLAQMYRDGKLKRFVDGLSGMGDGWPRWVYVYELEDGR